MQVNILRSAQPVYIVIEFRQMHLPPNGFQRVRIRRLNPDFQLDKPRTERLEQSKFRLIQKIRADLEMKIGNSLVMVTQITPDCHRALMITVKCPVYELDLRHFPVDEILQLPEHSLDISETDMFVNGAETIGAVERTPAA